MRVVGCERAGGELGAPRPSSIEVLSSYYRGGIPERKEVEEKLQA